MKFDKILADVGDYYTEKVQAFGATAKGADWNSEESQHLRFEQLLKVIHAKEPFSILDYGCGYGSLYEWMSSRYSAFDFTG